MGRLGHIDILINAAGQIFRKPTLTSPRRNGTI